jgi:Cytochrome P460
MDKSKAGAERRLYQRSIDNTTADPHGAKRGWVPEPSGEAMTVFTMPRRRLLIPATVVAAFVAVGTPFASTDDSPKIPANFQHGYLVNAMLVAKEPSKTGLIAGIHLIYLNRTGFARLKQGGSAPFPEGTTFVDDVRDFSVDEGTYQQGPRKFLTAMVKDSKKYTSTGGWGFQAWPAGDASKPIVTDAAKQCFSCHTLRKDNDFVYSTFLN